MLQSDTPFPCQTESRGFPRRRKMINKFKLEPIVDLTTGKTFAWELLFLGQSFPVTPKQWLRWYGEISDLVDQAREIIAEPECMIHVNLDTDHIYCEKIMSCFKALRDQPIALEWTERESRWSSIDDMLKAGTILEKARSLLGFKIILDDFGNGCSFRRLCAITPDMIKIDGQIFHLARKNPKFHTAIRQVCKLFNQTNIGVTIEWIETKTDLELAKQLKAKYGQGYHFL
jgi:EAL domain-containing protein (putative c-di-GMP-specific phosphodiesterase class I)